MKTLVCLNTCNRLNELKKNIIPFLLFCIENESFDFVLSLDGNTKDYIDFCEKYNIPLIYSLEREGVGLSKNRVLKQFSNYDYYFFIEDDIELLDDAIFNLILKAAEITGTPHFCNNHLKSQVKREFNVDMHIPITQSMTGGAQFCFFSKAGLEKTGGWHPTFAKYKRFGHTEHSYRFVHAGLQEYPFVFIEGLHESCLIINSPPAVTKLKIKTNQNQLIPEEQAMIDAKQSFYPLTTLSEFYFNGADVSIPQLHPDLQKGRYALLKGRDKIKAWGNYYFHKFKASGNPFYLIIGVVLFPHNNLLKHYIKTKLARWINKL